MQMTGGPNEASPLQIAEVRDFNPKGNKKHQHVNQDAQKGIIALQQRGKQQKLTSTKEDEELNKEINEIRQMITGGTGDLAGMLSLKGKRIEQIPRAL